MALKVGVVGMRGIGNRHATCHAENELADLGFLLGGEQVHLSHVLQVRLHPGLALKRPCVGAHEAGSGGEGPSRHGHFHPALRLVAHIIFLPPPFLITIRYIKHRRKPDNLKSGPLRPSEAQPPVKTRENKLGRN